MHHHLQQHQPGTELLQRRATQEEKMPEVMSVVEMLVQTLVEMLAGMLEEVIWTQY